VRAIISSATLCYHFNDEGFLSHNLGSQVRVVNLNKATELALAKAIHWKQQKLKYQKYI